MPEMTLLERFTGEGGTPRLIEVLLEQRLVQGNQELAESLRKVGELLSYKPGEAFIEQDAAENDIFFILAGSARVVVNGREVAVRSAGTHVGEMAAIEPSQPRSASVVAIEPLVVLRITESEFSALAATFPQLWRGVAKELSRRLRQRNRLVTTTHDNIKVFIVSSVEALPIARGVQESLEHDPFSVTVWTDGIFKASFYAIESLEAAVDQSDFAIAIAVPDDVVESRGATNPVPRDNVIFELGFFMGRLGRHRTILMEPRGEEVKLPTDLSGINTITYRPSAKPTDLLSVLGPACNKLRAIFEDLGPNN